MRLRTFGFSRRRTLKILRSFTYVEKGLWALIAAQTTLTIYAGDQLSQSLQKMIGTALGLLYGMGTPASSFPKSNN